MGGHALKNTNTIRIDLNTLNKTKKEIKNIIGDEIIIAFPFENPDKTDFGDIDILYQPESNIDIFNFIVKKFNPKEIVANGGVISFSYKLDENNFVQIDFIKSKILNLSKFYFSYGDVGQIIGMMTKYYGLSFGDSGLFIKQFNNETFTEKIYLSDNIQEICKYLDLDYFKWGSFLSEIEIFEWLKSSKMCHPNIFISGNHEHRHKILTRPMYGRFIKWLDNNCTQDKYNKYNKQNEAIEYFNKKDYLIKLLDNQLVLSNRKQKFNGNKLLELKVVKDAKDLGKFIKAFKNNIEGLFGNFDNWLDTNNEIIINKYIMEFNYK